MNLRVAAPAAIVALSLVVSVGATVVLARAADEAVGRVLDERLRGAGEAAALLLPGRSNPSADLAALAKTHALDGAYLLDGALNVLADSAGRAPRRADLLRVDPDRVARAFGGEPSSAVGWALGRISVRTAYFPIRDADGRVSRVLALEAGEAFGRDLRPLRTAVPLTFLGVLLGTAALAFMLLGWSRSERARAEAAKEAIRAATVRELAAVVAHEVRNPLGIIRGTVELMQARLKERLQPKDEAALEDVLDEVERLRRLTEDFTDLAAERAFTVSTLRLAPLLEDTARAVERAFPRVTVEVEAAPGLEAAGDPGRLRQVLLNLLQNAAQAQEAGTISLLAQPVDRGVSIRVRDSGPGVPPSLRARLFEPFETGREGGSGLGLAVARRWVERHGGTLCLLDEGPGAVFEIVLPAPDAAR